ncbi:MAG: class I SAM-dependent methyltransferase [Gammaproteobacteria bacterium]
MNDNKPHWEHVYATRQVTEVSWYQTVAEPSLSWIAATGILADAAIIDIGGGTSNLSKSLLDAGYTNLTVLDISATALNTARQQMGADAGHIAWLEADISTPVDFPQHYTVWHDRAVLHFLTTAKERTHYLDNMRRALKPGGHLILATFAENGPAQCSGLPVQRYSAATLTDMLGGDFMLQRQQDVLHLTPVGHPQAFVYLHFQRV